MNRTKRTCASVTLSTATLLMTHAEHHLWQTTRVWREGLTPKEIELIEKKKTELAAMRDLLSKVHHRLRQTGRCT